MIVFYLTLLLANLNVLFDHQNITVWTLIHFCLNIKTFLFGNLNLSTAHFQMRNIDEFTATIISSGMSVAKEDAYSFSLNLLGS